MEIENISRKDLKRNIMKNVIFRLDFQGVLDIEEFIKKIRNADVSIFSGLLIKEEGNLNIEFRPNLSILKEIMGLSDQEILEQQVYEFFNNNNLNGEVKLYIGKYYLMLTVECNENYKNIDEYVDYFSLLTKKLISKNKFIALKRFGLRKISYDYFYDLEDVFKVFNDKRNKGDNLINEKITRSLKGIKNGSDIYYFRSLEDGLLVDESGKEIEGYQAKLDFDAYYDSEYLRENWKVTNPKIAEDIYKLNDDLFELFKYNVTKEFLEKNI